MGQRWGLVRLRRRTRSVALWGVQIEMEDWPDCNLTTLVAQVICCWALKRAALGVGSGAEVVDIWGKGRTVGLRRKTWSMAHLGV